MMIRFLILSSILFYSCLNAEEVDLTISTNMKSFEEVEFQDVISFSITLTNNGNENAGTNTNTSFPNDILTSNIQQDKNGFIDVSFEINSDIQQDCFFVQFVLDPPPNGNVSYVYDFAFPIIPAHSSVTCYGTYHIGFESGRRSIKFKAYPSLDDFDINPDNNEIEIVFGIKPKVIPIFTTLGLILIVFLFIYLAYFKLSRNET